MNPSDQNDKIIDTGDIEPPKSWRRSWEIRSLFFIMRIMAVLFFISYLIFASGSSWVWIKMKWVRHQPVEQVTERAEAYIKAGKGEKVLEWVSLRHPSDRPVIMEKLAPLVSELDSALFLNYSQWTARAGDMDQAIFWTQYARYRLRFDALRCGIDSSVNDMTGLLELASIKGVRETIDKNPDIVGKSLQQVMDFDAKQPAANDPKSLCKKLADLNQTTARVMPRENWAETRHMLRLVTEKAIRDMKEGKTAE